MIHTYVYLVINSELAQGGNCKAPNDLGACESAGRCFRLQLLRGQPINKFWHHTFVLPGLSSRIGFSGNGTAEGCGKSDTLNVPTELHCCDRRERQKEAMCLGSTSL